VKLYRDEAVVLRAVKLGEADRIVTLLTRWHGKVRAVAKGVRRTSSRFGARLEPFMVADLQLHEGRNLDTVTQAVTLAPYASRIAADFELYTAANAIAETAEKLIEIEREPATQLYHVTVGALRALTARAPAPGLVVDSFLVRALAVAGYAPSFTDCARCGAPGPHRSLAPQAGGAVCDACRPPGSAAPAPEVSTLLAALLTGGWETADASSPRARREAAGIVAAFVQWHMERQVRSLRLVERA
jgi:DNA repair protein RecO (recombination protein O)